MCKSVATAVPSTQPLHQDVQAAGRGAGLDPKTRLHDLRHGVATQLARAGVHPHTVSSLLCHSSVAFTMDVSTEEWDEGAEQAATALSSALEMAAKWQQWGSERVRQRTAIGEFVQVSRGGPPGNRTLNLRIKRSKVCDLLSRVLRVLPAQRPDSTAMESR